MFRVIVVVNKWWELDPLLFVLLHEWCRPANAFTWPTFNRHPRPRPASHTPEVPDPIARAVFMTSSAKIEIWCISDLLEHLENQYQSSSEKKAQQLWKVFTGEPPALVIAFGTAALPVEVSSNGSVVAGTRVFMHNCHPSDSNQDSKWNQGPFDRVIDSLFPPGLFDTLLKTESPILPPVISRLLLPPLHPAMEPAVVANHAATVLCSVNVTDSTEYEQSDRETIAAFLANDPDGVIGSVETTDGLIRVLGGDQFLFISGIVNRVGHFHEDVEPRRYAQNTVAAHNAGIVLANALTNLDLVLR